MTTQQQSLTLLIWEAHIPTFVRKLPERYGYGVYYTMYAWPGFQSHVPVKGNRSADFQFRNFNDRTEWELNPSVFQGIITIFGEPKIDLFASYLNAKVRQYYSWKPDPGAMHIDALQSVGMAVSHIVFRLLVS